MDIFFEKYRCILANLLIGCNQRIIRIHLCCLLIIISRADLGDIADLIFVSCM